MTGLLTSLLITTALATAIMLPRPRLTFAADRMIDCSDVVERVLEKSGGRLLSVRPHDDKCTVTVLVHEDGKRPYKLVVRMGSDSAAADDASDQGGR
jgi:hypothetical protein